MMICFQWRYVSSLYYNAAQMSLLVFMHDAVLKAILPLTLPTPDSVLTLVQTISIRITTIMEIITYLS